MAYSSEITGIMGDVPDGLVYTDLLKTIPRGSTAIPKMRVLWTTYSSVLEKRRRPNESTDADHMDRWRDMAGFVRRRQLL